MGAMVVLDRTGKIVLDSLSATPRNGNFADREYFAFQRDTPAADGFYISRPFSARLQQGTPSLSISRRMTAPDGSFAGIVSGTLKIDYIQSRLDSIALGQHGVASVLRTDGVVLAQNVEGNPNIGADWSRAAVFRHAELNAEGTFSTSGTFDGVARLYAYAKVSGFPIIVTAGIARKDILTPYWSKIQLLAAVVAAMSLSVIVLVAMFNRELRRRIAAERGQAALAREDTLSQLANRRGFNEALMLEWRRAMRERLPVSLLMIDVDHFKKYNDRYGHPQGDKVLAAVGGIIGGSIRRPGDTAARYGGEEFVVLLPNTTGEGATVIAENIRQLVCDMAVPHERSEHKVVTVSLGLATVTPGSQSSEKTLIEYADRALYTAKAGGRNKVYRGNTEFPAFDDDVMRRRA